MSSSCVFHTTVWASSPEIARRVTELWGSDPVAVSHLVNLAKHDMTFFGWIKLDQAQVTLLFPDPRNTTLAALEEHLTRVRADFARQVIEIQSQINSLLAIEG